MLSSWTIVSEFGPSQYESPDVTIPLSIEANRFPSNEGTFQWVLSRVGSLLSQLIVYIEIVNVLKGFLCMARHSNVVVILFIF